MFEPDPEYADGPIQELKAQAGDVGKSVVGRGRAILEVGRRSVGDAELGAVLVAWAADPEFRAKRWVGAATLGWIAAAAAGYSQSDPARRAQLKAALLTWPPEERQTMLSWAREESWFQDLHLDG